MAREPDLETMLLGPVLPDRACGDCTACCTTLTVDTPEFAKPAGTPCMYLTERGCGIHAVRPTICRTWFCVWRRLPDLPQDSRPDRSGLLVSLNYVKQPKNLFEGVSINVRLLPGSTAIADGMAARVLDGLSDWMIPIWFSDGSEKMLMHPDREVAALVLSGDAPPAHLADEVAAWRERYGVFGT